RQRHGDRGRRRDRRRRRRAMGGAGAGAGGEHEGAHGGQRSGGQGGSFPEHQRDGTRARETRYPPERTFGMVRAWGGTTRTCRGRSWRRGCPTAVPSTSLPAATAVTARHGRASASP